jgi:hypothetical protein
MWFETFLKDSNRNIQLQKATQRKVNLFEFDSWSSYTKRTWRSHLDLSCVHACIQEEVGSVPGKHIRENTKPGMSNPWPAIAFIRPT